MGHRFACPHGHRWELSGDATFAGDAPACPVCGLGASDEEHSGPDTVTFQGADSNPIIVGPRIDEPSAPQATVTHGAASPPPVGPPVVRGYTILGQIGRGSVGAVFKARQVSLNRLVALKIIRAANQAAAAARFHAEAMAVARLQHPNIVQVYDFGECEGGLFLALELCAGGTLADQLDGTPWPPEAAARLVATLAGAAHAAHEHGVVHRDLKPANVLLTESGQLKIIDFGVAALVNPSAAASPEIVGTPAYMAPEQAAGRADAVGPAIDVYALGVILYELLTGRQPYRGKTAQETIQMVQSRVPPRRPSVLRAGLPLELERTCLRCLDKSPTGRPASARELAEELYRYLEEVPTEGPGPRQRGAADLEAFLHQRAVVDKGLRRQERLARTLLTAVSDGVALLDARGRLVEVNPAAEAVFGAGLPGLPFAAWIGGCEGSGMLINLMAGASAGETTPEVEVFVRPTARPEGAWIATSARPLLGDHGDPDGVVVVVREITERRQLRDSEALYQSLLETLPLCVFRKDLEGRFTFVNRTFCRTLGLPAGRILGRTDADLFPPSMAQKYRRDDEHLLSSGEIFEEIEEHQQSACGHPCRCGRRATPAPGDPGMKYLHVLLAPIYNALGQVVGTQGAFWDETARVVAERQLLATAAELKKANADLKRSNDDLEQFAFAASHDLQEPLRMVASFTRLLERDYNDRLDDRAREFIGYAVDGAKRMEQLIKDILAISRVGRMGQALRPTPARASYDEAIGMLEGTIAERRAVVHCGPLPTVWCDPIQLKQVFYNLIGNAIKFCIARTPVIYVSARDEDGFCVFSVRDNGIGIDPRHQDRVFTMFVRLHSRDQFSGSGIGLALCKKIVERHGGRIWVEGQLGQGSVFSFSLPAHTPESAGDEGRASV